MKGVKTAATTSKANVGHRRAAVPHKRKGRHQVRVEKPTAYPAAYAGRQPVVKVVVDDDDDRNERRWLDW